MYHQQQLHGHSQHLSSRPGLPPEKQFLLQGGDAGLVLSTDAKPRLKWTPELHERFVEAVHQLGGPDKATPKTIMRVMGIPGLTLYHLKSHLQVQRHLQLRIEAQGKYLQSVLEKAQEALAKQSVDLDGGVLGTAAAAETQQLSELISRASATKRVQHEHLHHQHLGGVGDGSVDSCLTACDGSQSQRDHDMLSIGLSPAPTPRGGCPFEAARSGNDRRGASTGCEEFLFLEEPGRRGSSSDEQQELDLNINDRNTPRPRNCEKIDLNGSSWN
ncbi:Myb family transcription factor APL [Dichanthelium oligosanthes]|uniref:Myb family transcription factor APL n=1 Tax=Dichanthelium oligosanthes TaxID=888268 RepID=A0A1E5WGV3_9POAL|nr:Myb family transcription factor APL [Dichanthelium oligosanthes]